ncbi:MAG: hypothetical protein ABIX12_02015 [Rubrivivax sp.]
MTARSPNQTRGTRAEPLPPPLVWHFDGPLEQCWSDLEDTWRRAIVMVGGVSRVALQIDLSLPALKRRVEAGDALQPGWTQLLERLERYGLPSLPRVRPLRTEGPVAKLVVAYLN